MVIRLDVRGVRVSQPGQALLPSSRLTAILSETLDEELHIEGGDQITVRGSTNASTPAWLRVHSRRYASSAECPPPRSRPNRFTPVERTGAGIFSPATPDPTELAPGDKMTMA